MSAPSFLDEPMWYAAEAEIIRRAGGPAAQRLLAACEARWPGAPVIIDVQVAHMHPGRSLIFPEAMPLHHEGWRGTPFGAEVALITMAEAPVVAVGGEALPPDGAPRFFSSGALAQGLPWPTEGGGHGLIALARRAAVGEALNIPRRTPRAFGYGPRPLPMDEPLPPWTESRPLRFHSSFLTLGGVPHFTQAQIAREPVPDRCTPTWLATHGGPIAKAFVAALPEAWRAPEADVFVHGRINELSPGFSPCLAGWHIDGTSRINKRPDGAPDLLNPGRMVENIVCCVGPTATTGFLIGKVDMPVPPLNHKPVPAKSVMQRLLYDAMRAGQLTQVQVPPYTLAQFTFGDYHGCRPATGPGWRFFIKAMRNRADIPRNQFVRNGQIIWDLDQRGRPEDALGVFPVTLPIEPLSVEEALARPPVESRPTE